MNRPFVRVALSERQRFIEYLAGKPQYRNKIAFIEGSELYAASIWTNGQKYADVCMHQGGSGGGGGLTEEQVRIIVREYVDRNDNNVMDWDDWVAPDYWSDEYLSAICQCLTEEQVRALVKKYVDSNDNGIMDWNEMKVPDYWGDTIYNKSIANIDECPLSNIGDTTNHLYNGCIGMTEERIIALIKEYVDANNNGIFDWEDGNEEYWDNNEYVTAKLNKLASTIYNTNQKILSRRTVTGAPFCHGLTEEQVRNIIKEYVDANNNGILDWNDETSPDYWSDEYLSIICKCLTEEQTRALVKKYVDSNDNGIMDWNEKKVTDYWGDDIRRSNINTKSNIDSNIYTDPSYNGCIGMTEERIIGLIKEYIDANNNGEFDWDESDNDNYWDNTEYVTGLSVAKLTKLASTIYNTNQELLSRRTATGAPLCHGLTEEQVRNIIKEYVDANNNGVMDWDDESSSDYWGNGSYINGVKLYSVGLISDVHHDDMCEADGEIHNPSDSGNSDKQYEDLDHALEFFSKDPSIKFLSCSGDICSDNMKQVKAFHNHVLSHGSGLRVFTCKGNHDNMVCNSQSNNDEWKAYTIPEDTEYSSSITMFESGDKTSFYFVTKNGDVYIYFNLDYNNSSMGTSKYIDDGKSRQFYGPDTIIELQQILDRYRNNRCFVFTHQPFVNKAGVPGYVYSKKRGYGMVLSGKQFALLNAMHNHYKNSIWFSGHTHFQWKWASMSERANFCNWDVLNNDYNYNDFNDFGENIYNKYSEQYSSDYIKSGYAIHIPSLARPVYPTGPNTDSTIPIASEAAVMEVYDKGVKIKGIVFADENTTIDQEVENTEGVIITSNDIKIDTSKQGYVENVQTIKQLPDGYVEVAFGEGKSERVAQRFFITNYTGNILEIEDISIYNTNTKEDYTEILLSKSNPYIGFYGTDGKYYLSTTTVTTDDIGIDENGNTIGGIQINVSSQFNNYNNPQVTLPITIKFKGYTSSSGIIKQKINYKDEFLDVAECWIPIGDGNIENIESKDYNFFNSLIKTFDRS